MILLRSIIQPNGSYIRIGTEHKVELINGDSITVKVHEIREESESEHIIFVEFENSVILWKRIKNERIYEYDLNEFLE